MTDKVPSVGLDHNRRSGQPTGQSKMSSESPRSSIASIRSPKGVAYVAYNASKGAVNGLTIAIASQYAEKGIRCNAILPGLMHTPMIDFLAEEYVAGPTLRTWLSERGPLDARQAASVLAQVGSALERAAALARLPQVDTIMIFREMRLTAEIRRQPPLHHCVVGAAVLVGKAHHRRAPHHLGDPALHGVLLAPLEHGHRHRVQANKSAARESSKRVASSFEIHLRAPLLRCP